MKPQRHTRIFPILATVFALLWSSSGWAQFTLITNNGAITVTGYTGTDSSITIPSTIYNYPVISIGDHAFLWNTKLLNVIISNGISSLGFNAFAGCVNLTNISIPNSVTDIGTATFVYCGFMNVTIPDGVGSIGDYAFYSCTNLTSVSIPANVTSIGKEAFYFCTNLSEVIIGNNVVVIGDYAFADCSNLKNVTMPSVVSTIGYSSFANCYGLQQVYFQGNSPSIDGSAGYSDNTVFSGESGLVYYVPGTSGWGSTFGGWPTAQWYQPQPQILDSSYGLGVQNNQFNFTISWATNTSVTVQTSTNLLNWIPISTNTLVNGTNLFSDPNWKNYSQQFYRVKSQ